MIRTGIVTFMSVIETCHIQLDLKSKFRVLFDFKQFCLNLKCLL